MPYTFIENVLKQFYIENVLQKEELEKFLETKFLEIKYSEKHKNLILLNIKKGYEGPFEEFHNTATGIVVNLETLKSICIPFPRVYEKEEIFNNTEELNENFYQKNVECLERMEEGTLIRVYNYNNEWIVSTPRCIDTTESFVCNNKGITYTDLFYEIANEVIDFEKMDKSFTYIFLLSHPLNRCILKYNSNPQLIFLGRNDTISGCSIYNEDISIISKNDIENFQDAVAKKYSLKNIHSLYKKKNLASILEFVKTKKDFYSKGFFLVLKNNKKISLKFEYFKKLEKVRGTNPNLKIRYIELLLSDDTESQRLLINNYYDELKNIKKEINERVVQILKEYQKIYIYKKYTSDTLEDKPLKKILYDIHFYYKKTRNPIQKELVYSKLMENDSSTIGWIMKWI